MVPNRIPYVVSGGEKIISQIKKAHLIETGRSQVKYSNFFKLHAVTREGKYFLIDIIKGMESGLGEEVDNYCEKACDEFRCPNVSKLPPLEVPFIIYGGFKTKNEKLLRKVMEFGSIRDRENGGFKITVKHGEVFYDQLFTCYQLLCILDNDFNQEYNFPDEPLNSFAFKVREFKQKVGKVLGSFYANNKIAVLDHKGILGSGDKDEYIDWEISLHEKRVAGEFFDNNFYNTLLKLERYFLDRGISPDTFKNTAKLIHPSLCSVQSLLPDSSWENRQYSKCCDKETYERLLKTHLKVCKYIEYYMHTHFTDYKSEGRRYIIRNKGDLMFVVKLFQVHQSEEVEFLREKETVQRCKNLSYKEDSIGKICKQVGYVAVIGVLLVVVGVLSGEVAAWLLLIFFPVRCILGWITLIYGPHVRNVNLNRGLKENMRNRLHIPT